MTVRRTLKIARLGVFAREALDSAIDVRLLGVFDRSIHFVVDDTVVCVVDNKLGNGPLNAVLAPMDGGESLRDWTRLAGRPGDPAYPKQCSLHVGQLVLDLSHACLWLPAACPPQPATEALRPALERLDRIGRDSAPDDGLSRLVLGGRPSEPSTVTRMAQPRLDELDRWICDEISGRRSFSTGSRPGPAALLGLGPGLTPSGDDVLCGAMIALHAGGRSDAAGRLGASVLRYAGARTTGLSRAFLRAAAEGQGSEALHVLLVAVLSGQTDQLDALVGDVARIGHTSGWDALAGAVLVLRAFAGDSATRHGIGPNHDWQSALVR
jgi:hypothetical protein